MTTTDQESPEFVAVGRRKTATARVRLRSGAGNVTINGKTLDEYLPTEQLSRAALRPFQITGLRDQYDVRIKVEGSGPEGQAGAISHGLARALQKLDPELRAPLKKAGLIRRDPRMKERKKPGQPGARARFQFSKR